MLMAWASQQYGAAPPFVPEDLGAKLLAWWDAEEASTLTLSGSQIAGWADKVTSTNLTQGVGGSRPVLNATAFGGRPAAVFDGIDDFVSIASVFLPSGSNTVEAWVLASPPDGVSDAAVTRIAFAYGDGSTNGDLRMRRQVSSGISRHSPVAGASLLVPTAEYAGPSLVYAGSFADRLDAKIGAGGTPETVAATPNRLTNRTLIGSRANSTPGTYWLGGINTIICTSELTSGERTQLENYLAGRL